jgi:predicted ribonuclease toxin of YeeF-YezG toxin-antitoxin module
MKQIIIGLVLLVMASAAVAGISENELRQFEKGKTTYDQVVVKLGPPMKTGYNDEGLRAIAYVEQSTRMNSTSTAAMLGSLASIFIPGAAGLAASTASLVAQTVGGGAEGTSSFASFTFDKNGRLIYFISNVVSANAGTFDSKTSSKQISSEDGATPLPNIKVTLSDDQRNPPPISSPDGKPRLGIKFVPIAFLDEASRNKLAAAKFDGLIVTVVAKESVADKAGIREGDYLYIINGMLVYSIDDVVKAMSTVTKGNIIKARARRIDPNANVYREQVFSLQF